MWSHLLVERMTGEEHVIFHGTPRSLQEAQIIDTTIAFYGRQRPHAICLNITPETSKARMMARRSVDDISAEEVERRLTWFETDVLPAVEYFRSIQTIILSNLMAISRLRRYSRSSCRKFLAN